MHICLSVSHIYTYLSINVIDRHVSTDRYVYISVYIYVYIMNVLWVGLRQILPGTQIFSIFLPLHFWFRENEHLLEGGLKERRLLPLYVLPFFAVQKGNHIDVVVYSLKDVFNTLLMAVLS